MRTPLIAGNWKMNGTVPEAVDLAKALREAIGSPEGVEVLVCPPFTALAAVREVLDGGPVALGAQDMHWERKGAFTGEVSSAMLRDLGCTHVILGHSERRHILGETNEMVNRKLHAALEQDLTPIVCVGELLEEKNMKVTKEVIEKQVTRALDGVAAEGAERIVFAYEPVWAIGTGMTATPRTAQDVQRFLRNLVARHLGPEVAGRMRIQYGGSVKPDNIRDLMDQPDVDGALVGGASLQADSFARIAGYKE